MSNIMQDLHTVGLNPFAVTLLAESLLKSPLAPLTVGKPQGVFFPIQRSDCPGWVGVRITLEAVPKDAALAAPPAVPQPEPDWLHLKRYGYAPGNYMNRCHVCEAMFSDLDKRASTCRPCAEQLHARAHGITAKGEQP